MRIGSYPSGDKNLLKNDLDHLNLFERLKQQSVNIEQQRKPKLT